MRTHSCGRLRGTKSQNQDQSTSTVCDICGRTFYNKSNMQIHRESHLPQRQRIFECFICQKQYSFMKSLKQHISNVHVDVQPEFKCGKCGKTFTWKYRFIRHLKIHTNEFPFDCTHCGKKFRFKDKLAVRNFFFFEIFAITFILFLLNLKRFICRHMFELIPVKNHLSASFVSIAVIMMEICQDICD